MPERVASSKCADAREPYKYTGTSKTSLGRKAKKVIRDCTTLYGMQFKAYRIVTYTVPPLSGMAEEGTKVVEAKITASYINRAKLQTTNSV